MDLQKHLDESGYTESLEKLEAAKGQRAVIVEGLPTATNPEAIPEFLESLKELDEWIAAAEKVLAAEYEAAVKLVDSHNDLDFQMLDIKETAELLLEYVEQDFPGDPKTVEIRKIVECMRKDEAYEPDDGDS